MVMLEEADIMASDKEKRMGQWAFRFNEAMGLHCLRRPRFSELRPSSLK